MKTKLKMISALLVLAVITTLIPCAAAATSIKLNNITFSASANEEYSSVVANQSSTTRSARNYTITSISCDIDIQMNREYADGLVILGNGSDTVEVDVSGSIDYFENANGYVGVFDGLIVKDNVEERITVDMLYRSPEDNFTAVTIGSAGDRDPQIVFFGEFSETVSALSALNVEKTAARAKMYAEKERESDNARVATAVDARTRFQSTHTLSSSGYEMVTISLYHANELRNQSSMSVYAKVNSHTADFKDYLKEVHGYDNVLSTLSVSPDSYMIEIVGADHFLHSDGVFSPGESSTSQTITFPAYLPKIGFFTFDITYPISSVDIDTRGAFNDPIYTDNIVTWNVYKNGGWGSAFNGYYDDNAGGVVRTNYTYEDYVTSDRDVVMGAYGQIRYEYIYAIFPQSMTLHMWTDKAMCSNYLTIVP